MFERRISSIKKEFNENPHAAVAHAYERLIDIGKLKPADQMELAGIFARGSAQGDVSAVDAAGAALQQLKDRDSGKLSPKLYPTLLTIVGNGADSNVWVSMRVLGRTIGNANLTNDEQSKLIDAIEHCKDTRSKILGAREALVGLSEVRTTVANAERLANVIRGGIESGNTHDREFALESMLEVLQKSGMRDGKGEVLQSLARDCAAAIRTEKVNTQMIDEDSRAFLARLSAFAADGPVPVWKPEPPRHGIHVTI